MDREIVDTRYLDHPLYRPDPPLPPLRSSDRWTAITLVMMFGGILSAVGYPPPCEVQANLQQPAADFIIDADTHAAASANRVLIVGTVTDIVLPSLDLVIRTEEGFEVTANPRAAVKVEE